jgi:PhzF family phenazine biosynthesis protein
MLNFNVEAILGHSLISRRKMHMRDTVFFVNAFATDYYKGNTAAVVIPSAVPEEKQMQALAAEFGFSETAFLQKLDNSFYHIRWFTPETEVPLCGHATLASAQALFSSLEQNSREIRFQSLSGILAARKVEEDIELDFPSEPLIPHQISEEVLKALGCPTPAEVLLASRSRNLVLVFSSGQQVLDLSPDFANLARLKGMPFFGIAATAQTDDGYICRYFAPWEGINEDPVTGSAQTFLAPFWSMRLRRNILRGYQASKRGGGFEVEVLEDRARIRGRAFIYMQGILDPSWRLP